jgi:hypothetical protein
VERADPKYAAGNSDTNVKKKLKTEDRSLGESARGPDVLRWPAVSLSSINIACVQGRPMFSP